MKQAIAQVTLVVKNYDEAIEFYTKKLGFTLVDDIALDEGKRWVTVSPPSLSGLSLLLAEATNEEQRKAVGNQTGGRVFLFLHTDDFWRDYKRMQEQGVEFNEDPRDEPYGTVVVFKDLYGNLWDLIERK
ncbi:Catechol 2,3-dioxygenase [Zobellia uliginosa]|uniref:Catechol 2,3-dioxygenase n=1 Tax=Zobellia uliginosa TaxID=143224 RepID=A0ABY1KP29_9FLAO|nr:VOC family protein [Zobellia uliginosa]MDO6518034.1 VOC family protein [Zobellia uliginosa]SIS55762.1 Catechol 2,3-dioxygenase [Zobellia uliginosa]